MTPAKTSKLDRLVGREASDDAPLLTFLASDLSKDMNGNTFFCGGGRIAEMKVVTTTGVTKKEGGGLWTPQEIADAMKPGEILLPE